ncbi:MAG TPA: ATP-binding protein [Burkholderiaceae bacterium]|jgi:signal transduction histidine kinase
MLPARAERTIYWRVLTPFLLAVLTLVAVSVGGFRALSGARAYVGGESQWSKASTRALAQLRERTLVATGADCALDDWLAVPLGDRDARLALELPTPELAAARAGFTRGGSAPADIEAMIDLYRILGRTPLLHDAIASWRRGDALIEELQALGGRLCGQAPGTSDAAARGASLQALDRLDAEMRIAEDRFSQSLGAASRQSERLLIGATALLALLLVGGGVWTMTHSLRAQAAQRRALLDANTRWDLAAGAAGVGVFVWHPGSDGIELDRRARSLYGLAADGPSRVSRAELAAQIHPDDRGLVDERRRSAIGGQPLQVRYRVVVDGQARHLEAIGVVRNPGAAVAQRQMFGVIRDVTDEVLASRLQIEKDAAERSARARAQFLSRLSHELRTPLNAVLGLAQVMELDAGDPLSAQQRARVELMLQSGWHLVRLVDDVLDITRIDDGTLRIKAAATDLREALHASLALVEPERASAGVQVVDELPATLPAVMADPKRLQQVFSNLLSNGCKYNRRGGTLTLGHREAVNEIAVNFSDQGPGISADEQAELFQPFARLPGTARMPGTGLGLVVVKLLAEQMGGRIEVASEPGRGTRFSLWLLKA